MLRSRPRRLEPLRHMPRHIPSLPPAPHLPSSSAVSPRKQAPVNQVPPDYKPIRILGRGAFGVVYCARDRNGSFVAIKKVKVDPRYKNRELEILHELHHDNVVRLLGSFKTTSAKTRETFVHFVMDYLPESLHEFTLTFRKERKYPPHVYVKLFAFQTFAGLAHLHSLGIVHRDIKPQNLIVDRATGSLKICDLGSAKRLVPGEPSVSYIASRYYRAPELLLDCVHYTAAVDIWAAGCCIAEVLLSGMPLFPGRSTAGQMREIVKILGFPTEEDLRSFPHGGVLEPVAVKATGIAQALPKSAPEDVVELLRGIFVYAPGRRPTAEQCMQHRAFDELFELPIVLPSGKPMPPITRQI